MEFCYFRIRFSNLILGSSLATPFLGEFIMFGMPLIFAMIGGWH